MRPPAHTSALATPALAIKMAGGEIRMRARTLLENHQEHPQSNRGHQRSLALKKAIKAFCLSGYLGGDGYLLTTKADDDRNQLIYLYDPENFNQIIERLPAYAALMNGVCEELKQSRQ